MAGRGRGEHGCLVRRSPGFLPTRGEPDAPVTTAARLPAGSRRRPNEDDAPRVGWMDGFGAP
uniref:Uncharacterized protein n=1 Tax=Oryza meridionalis TaxID=40149 RepID=A0A0E0CW52_9ORYZ